MKNYTYKTITFLLLLIMVGCAPAIHTSVVNNTINPLADGEKVIVLTLNQTVPDSCKRLGVVKIADGGFTTNCGYERVMNEAKKQGRKMGGNIIKITRLREPGFSSTCYQVDADIYFIPDLNNLVITTNAQQDSITKSKFSDNPTFALLYVYRPASAVGSLIGYDVHLNDSVICRAKNNSYYQIKIFKEGTTSLWAKTEAKEEKSIDVKFGQEYFLKCGIVMGIAIGRPLLSLVDKDQGRSEFESRKKKKTKNDDW